MRRIFRFFGCTVLAAMLLTGCKNEELLLNNEVPVEKGKVSFVLPLGGSNQTVTYAPVAGTDAEYDIKRLVIFWFKDGDDAGGTPTTDKLFKRFAWGDNASSDFGSITMSNTTFTAAKKTGVATINVGDDAFNSKFYIVANVNGNSVMSQKMLNVKPGDTNRADFEAMLADALAEDNSATESGSIVQLGTPLPMSINASGTGTTGGYIAISESDIKSGTATSITAHLKRRVARFDVINNADYSNFKISRIYVSRAPRTGYLHDRPFDDSNATMWSKADSVGKFVVDTLAVKLNGTPITDTKDLEDDSGNPNPDGIPDVFQGASPASEKFEVNGPAFYLWPTVLDVAGQKTEIVIEGAFGSDKRLYKLELSSDVKIEANKVYRIKVIRQSVQKVAFTLEVDDWYDIVEIEANNKDKSLSYVDVLVTGQTAIPDTIKLQGSGAVSYTYSATNSNPVKLSFETVGTVKDAHHDATSYLALSVDGIAGVDYLQSDWDALEAAEDAVVYTTTTTYASQYVTKYELNLPPTDAPITVKLKIINAGNSAEAREIDLTSANFNKAGKATEGTILDSSVHPNLLSFGAGRWEKAMVTSVAANGMPETVYALLGTTTETDYTSFAQYAASTPEDLIAYLTTNCGGSIPYKAGETFVNTPNGTQIVPSSLVSSVVQAFNLVQKEVFSDVAGYRAIIVNYDKSASSSSTPEFPVLNASGTVNRRTNPDSFKQYSNSVVTAVINY